MKGDEDREFMDEFRMWEQAAADAFWGFEKSLERGEDMSEGYIYTAYGNEHLKETFKSLDSLRVVDPNAHTTLITTGNVNREYDFSKFNRVITSPHLNSEYLGGKVERMWSFYDKTIYLDTDTYICESLKPLFDLLDHYDVCIAPDPGEVEIEGIVAHNTGVMSFRASPAIEDMLALYRKYYFERELWKDHPGYKQRTDQPAFAHACRDSNVKVYVLPTNWNARYRFWTHLFPGTVKVVHGLDCDFEAIRKAMNVSLGNRIWNPRSKSLAETS